MENEPKPDNEVIDASSTSSDNSDSLDSQVTYTADVQGALDNNKATTANIDRKKSGFLSRFNIYLFIFIVVIVLAGVVTFISISKSKEASQVTTQQLTTEPLSKEALDQLRQTDVKVGDPKQVLSVESNAVFAGKVLIRDSLEVAGEIRSGAALNVTGLTVSGNTTVNQLQAAQMQIAGNASIQGQLNVQSSLSVSGSGSFGGSLTAASLNIQNLQISGDLQLNRHIDAGGATPGKADGGALGSGGTSSISGTDTAGTVAINTGGGTVPGCFATVNFNQRYNSTPHVVITPVGVAGGNVNYYINRSASNFSICTTNSAPVGQSFAFDYIVID